MYLFMTPDGNIEPAYKGFDPNTPDWEKLKEVKEVLCVTKVLVPQLKLVPKPKEQVSEPTPVAQSEPAKPKRTQKKKEG